MATCVQDYTNYIYILHQYVICVIVDICIIGDTSLGDSNTSPLYRLGVLGMNECMSVCVDVCMGMYAVCMPLYQWPTHYLCHVSINTLTQTWTNWLYY